MAEMMTQPTTPSVPLNRLPPNAVRSRIAKAATLEDAEAIFAEVRQTPAAVDAITKRRAGVPVLGPAVTQPKAADAERPVMISVDRQAEVVHELAAQGIPELRDFNERSESATQVPDWLKEILDERNLTVERIDVTRLRRDPRLVGPNRYLTPMTRVNFPEIPDTEFNTQGYMQWEDQVWCAGLRENADRHREMIRKSHAAKVSALEAKQRKQKGKGKGGQQVEGPIDMGILPGKELNPKNLTANVNKSLDKALSQAQ